ncbi:MAG TPA: FecR family protein, partial [Candidatus Limnocylindrales bacterium]|nr:FecR family protein [Candidatus Limnocylindrales bacterium]
MPGTRHFLMALLIPALVLLVVPPSRAQEQDELSRARIVRLSHLEGTVRIDGDRGFENATANVPLVEGNRLLTRSDGWAEVEFEDGSTLRLAPDSQILFEQLGRTAEGHTVTTVDLDQGEAELNIKKHDGDEFALTARNKTILLKHSGRFRVTATNSSPLQVAVFNGEVAVTDSSTGKEIRVKKNETFTLDAMDMGRYNLERGTENDDLDAWSSQRDQELSAYASAGSGDVQSPYQYGLSDLNYYGHYYDVPGYGFLWQPYGVNFGWDPFMNGYWAYSPWYGYTWVSAYPWGWMPYRYGHWIFINGRGWMWQPGLWHGWVRGPQVANAPPGFRPPAPPPVVTGSGTGTRTMQTQPARVPFLRGQPGVNSGNRRVFSNEDAQGRVPPTGDAGQRPSDRPVIRMENKPAIVEERNPQAPAQQRGNTGGTGEVRQAP